VSPDYPEKDEKEDETQLQEKRLKTRGISV